MGPNDGVLANHMQSVNDEHEQIDDFTLMQAFYGEHVR